MVVEPSARLDRAGRQVYVRRLLQRLTIDDVMLVSRGAGADAATAIVAQGAMIPQRAAQAARIGAICGRFLMGRSKCVETESGLIFLPTLLSHAGTSGNEGGNRARAQFH